MTLYELTNEFRQIMDDLEEIGDGEPTESTIAQLEAIESNIREKADGYCALIKHYQGMAEMVQQENMRLAARAGRFSTKGKWLQDRLKAAMESLKIPKIETPANTISIVNNGGLKPLSIEARAEELPEEYRKTVTTHQPDKDAIRKALEQGVTIPGCTLLERGKRLKLS